MKRILTALLIALFGVGLLGTPAYAAPSNTSTTVVTLDTNDTGLDLSPTAADLSARTGVTVVTGSCDGGLYCIEVSKDECTSGTAGGCAWAVENTCHVSIEPVAYTFDYWLTVFVASHEVVHCLTWIGGAGFFHVDDRPSILNSSGTIQTMRENQTKLNAADRKMIYSIFQQV